MTTEIEYAKDRLQREAARITTYERLATNPDFQQFKKELIDDKVEVLLRALEESLDSKQDEIIKEQFKVLRGIQRLFDTTLQHKKEVNEKLAELNKLEV